MGNTKRLSFVIVIALIGLATFQFLCRIKESTFQEQIRQGHTMSQWLRILRANTIFVDDPLTIVKITSNNKFADTEFEVPLSYDLLVAHEFLAKNGMEKNGKFDLIINGRTLSTYCERSTNGSCILECGANNFSAGTNQVQAELSIFNLIGAGPAISATGPVAEFISSNIYRVNEHITMDHVH